MALRWRNSATSEPGPLLCAAKHPAQDGDSYIDDALHYELAVVRRVVVPNSDEHDDLRSVADDSGIWHWAGEKKQA